MSGTDSTWFLEVLAHEGSALAAAARRGLEPPVPCCEGWTVADAVAHTAEVYQHKLAILRERRTTRPEEWQQQPPAGDVVAWYDDSLAEILEVLSAVDPATPVWTWWPPDQTAGFWRRRMALETAVHRVDVEQGHGEAAPIDTAVAADGIAEMLELMLGPETTGEDVGGSGERVLLAPGDHPDRWLIRLMATGIEVRRASDRDGGDVAARLAGSASDLLLWLYGRVPVERLARSGDEAVVARLRRMSALATQ